MTASAKAEDVLYKCSDAKGNTEYSSVPCKGKVFDPAKGNGTVTSIEMPSGGSKPAAKSSSPILTPEQKAQLDELGIKPGGPPVKSLILPDSWLK